MKVVTNALVTERGLDPDLASALDTIKEGAQDVKLKFLSEEIYTLAQAQSLTNADLKELGFKMGKRKAIQKALEGVLIHCLRTTHASRRRANRWCVLRLLCSESLHLVELCFALHRPPSSSLALSWECMLTHTPRQLL